jgi:gliding motility-associated-like protein
LPPTDSIQWFKDDIAISNANVFRYQVTQAGAYNAVLFKEDGCSIATSAKNILIEEPVPGITYPTQYAVINYSLPLQARSFGIGAEWAPATYLANPDTYTPTFSGPTDIAYTVTIETAAGCVTVDTQLVQITKQVKIHVPNAFTPNNDGLNDYLRPIPMGIREFKYFRIFNRWGQLIFDMRSNSRGWDGTLSGKLQGSGVFVWIAEGIGVDNRTYKEKGTAVLVR